ncbi:polyprenyl diphosphate synthase [Streptomyces niger]|uniref:polyprenyl diphosphate synthase n=1 Tax=Streptomyces niger TaxID=66373 RepID=UPI00069ACEE7|nr:polyprenyl diphosphate synthase [Streptomyces niger]
MSERERGGATPRHVGFIPDGNRRWARQHGLSVMTGHRRGGQVTVETLRWCAAAGVERVTVWALSMDNLVGRPEVGSMFTAITELAQELASMDGWRLHIIGNPEQAPNSDSVAALRQAERASAPHGPRAVNLAVGYDGREEIMNATRSLLARYPQVPLDTGALSREMERRHQPDCDLIIRTSGEYRLSGFLLWQSALAELYFAPELWPDFTEQSLHRALNSYARRERRFGA